MTASVQGHNINVFRIMPGQPVSSSGFDATASYVHLYRLQRGFTNAVSDTSLFFLMWSGCLQQVHISDPFLGFFRSYRISVSVMTATG